MSRRIARCLSEFMATAMRPSGVHVAWAHGIDDSERAGTVNTHCWKVALVAFMLSDRAPSGQTCIAVLRVQASWLGYNGQRGGRTLC